MKREDTALLMLSQAGGKPYQPVQIQKALFLISKKYPELCDEISRYHFEPYDYGPFDATVYRDIEELQVEGFASIERRPIQGWDIYRATDAGMERTAVLAAEIEGGVVSTFKRVSDFVLSCSFSELVAAIYKAFPEMRVNSVFRG